MIALAFVVGSGTFFKNQMQPLCFYNELPSEAGVAKVIDGGIIVLDGGEKVRYLGINAPEIRVRHGEWIPRATDMRRRSKGL